MPILPQSPSIHVYMKALATFVGVLLNMGEKSYNQVIRGEDYYSVEEVFDKIVADKLYETFHAQYKGILNGLIIRLKEYKREADESEWLSNIAEDSADLLGIIKEQFKEQYGKDNEHTLSTLGLYAEICLFRSSVMTERKITYNINRDDERNAMLKECADSFNGVFNKMDAIIDRDRKTYENCKRDEALRPRTPGTLVVFTCSMLEGPILEKVSLLNNLKKLKETIEKCII